MSNPLDSLFSMKPEPLPPSTETIASTLKSLRVSRQLTQADLTALLARFGVKMTGSAYSQWERTIAQPNSYDLIALARCLNGNASLENFLRMVPRPNAMQSGIASSVRSYIQGPPAAKAKAAGPEPEPVPFPVSANLASAGGGYSLFEDSFDTILLAPEEIPDRADFGVYVSGDSMEPVFHHGDLLFIEKTSVLRNGEYGLFVVDEEGLVKKLGQDTVHPDEYDAFDDFSPDSGLPLPRIPVLISENRRYAPRRILPYSSFSVIGRVISSRSAAEE